MRLVCPNCDAEYEVDPNLVPAEGRDVQCSNCTTTWFQPGPNAAPEPPEEAGAQGPQVAAEAEPDEADDAAAAFTAPSDRTPSRPELDPAAKEIIEQEVARETAAREAERGGIETQPDLGLDESETEERATAARDRMARMRGMEPQDDTAAQVAEDDPGLMAAPKRDDGGGKRELFPDIEEINSTLSPEAAEAEAEAARQSAEGGVVVQEAASKFRTGFGLMLLLSAGLLVLYVYAPQIGTRMPSLAEPLRDYVVFVDGLRVWLDTATQGLVEQIGTQLGDGEG